MPRQSATRARALQRTSAYQLELFHGRHREKRAPKLSKGAVCSRCDRKASQLVRVGEGYAARCSWHTTDRLPSDLARAVRRRA